MRRVFRYLVIDDRPPALAVGILRDLEKKTRSADRMIDMGFEPQVNAILDRMPASNMKPMDEEAEEKDRIYRQTFMFSATMPTAVERLAKKFLRRPIYVAIGVVGHAVDRIEQRIVMCKEHDKKNLLMDLLQVGYNRYVITSPSSSIC